MPKASRVLAGLKRDGWTEVRRRGSHRWMAKGELRGTWAWHDGDDLGNGAMRLVAKEFGYTVEQLRRL